jgi:folate-binding Fe-S cluster repair protein YgfZ
MLEMRGKVHRRLMKLALPADASVKPGEPVMQGGEVVGKITSASGRAALAMLKSSIEPGLSVEIDGGACEVVATAG